MKELVEEVRLLWCEECADGPLRAEHCGLAENKWDKACGTGAEDLCRERARKVIAHIVKGPLPGEKWRQQYGPKEVIIALRSTGTGKEEE